MNTNWRRDIRHLRLVNSAFASAVAPVLFEQIAKKLEIGTRKGRRDLAYLQCLSRSKFNVFVKNLPLDFSSHNKISKKREKVIKFAKQVHKHLPGIMANFQSIELLSLKYELEWKNHEFPDFDCVNDAIWPVCHELINSTIAKVLSTETWIRVKHFDLSLPCTNDIHLIMQHTVTDRPGEVNHAKMRHLMSGLKSLEVCLSDSSGTNGRDSDMEDLYLVETMGYRPSYHLWSVGSQLQWRQEFFSFINMANNITSLKIDGASPIDFTFATVESFRKLEHLELDMFEAEAQQLVDIFDYNCSSLITIRLRDIELLDGTWEEVLVKTCEVDSLYELQGTTCGCSDRGESVLYQFLGSYGEFDCPTNADCSSCGRNSTSSSYITSPHAER